MYSVPSIFDQLSSTAKDIDKQIREVHKLANRESTDDYRIEAHELRDISGAYLLSPLLVAKAGCLSGMAMLKAAEIMGKKR